MVYVIRVWRLGVQWDRELSVREYEEGDDKRCARKERKLKPIIKEMKRGKMNGVNKE